jgi:FKBP-type peptidyl-prolyl cis-trans isomerase FkpA
VFDKTVAGSPVSRDLGSFIDAWKELVPLIKQGGSMEMLVPSTSAYGLAGQSDRGMPPFSSLYFTLKVTDVSP